MAVTSTTTDKPGADFYKVPFSVYSSDPHWSQPFRMIEQIRMNDKQPNWEGCKRKIVLVRDDDGRPAARCVVFSGTGNTAYFGGFETENSGRICTKLLEEARKAAREMGATKLTGPLTFTMQEEIGLVTKGAGETAHFWTPYNPSYYIDFLENNGFTQARRFYGFRWNKKKNDYFSEWARNHLAQPRNEEDCIIRSFDIRNRKSEVETLLSLFNASFRGSWGFREITAVEGREIMSNILKFGDPELFLIAEIKGKPAGFMLCLPNMNEMLVKTRNLGRNLDILRFIHLLLARRFTPPRSIRVTAMALDNQYRKKNIALDLLAEFWKRGYERYSEAEFSYIDSEDVNMIKILDRLQFDIYKTYTIYSTEL